MYRNVPPHGSNPGNQNHLKGVSTSAASSKAKSMNNYFDDDDDDEDNNFTNSHLNSKNIGCEDDEVDPLDAFMYVISINIM